MKSLNDHSVNEVKNILSKHFKYNINDIRFFGSRIAGNWKDKSDLDVVIKDETKIDYDIIYFECLTLNCEIRFVENFNLSWLRNSL